MIDPRLLNIFILLAEERHFGRAAERAGMTQSSASMQLQRLEDIIGAPLLVRNKRAAVLMTDVGSRFLVEAKEALERLTQAETVGRAIARGDAGPVSLGYIFSAVPSGVLRLLLSHIRSTLPTVIVTPRQLETPEQIAAVAERRLDIGLVRPRATYPLGVRASTIHSEPLLLFVDSGHPLARLPSVAADALAAESFLLPQFNERVGLLEKLDRLATLGGFVMPDVLRTGDFVSAASLAASGYGVVLAPASLARVGIDGLVGLPIDGFEERIETALLWHEDGAPVSRRIGDAGARWMVDGAAPSNAVDRRSR